MKKTQNFWKELKKPIFVLAPMADVTDSAFRALIAKYSKPDVMWTEFVSADGLCLAPEKGKKKLLKDLEFEKKEHPIVAQIFGSKPEYIEEASRLCAKLGFDGVDINMGCPDKSIEKQKAGAAMMKNPELAREIIRAAKRGAGKIPVSVKTRIGYNKVELETWLPILLEEKPALITVHARTRKEMSDVPARWEFVKRAVEIRDEGKYETLIFGNGDVKDLDEAKEKVNQTGCDGVMLGRAIFGNPLLFTKQKEEDLGIKSHNSKLITRNSIIRHRLMILIEHTKLFEKKLTGFKNFAVMKKHFKAYVSDFENAKELREKLMQTENSKEVEKIIKDFINKGN